MRMRDITLDDIFFTHLENGVRTVFVANRLQDATVGFPVHAITVDPEFASFVREHRGIEQTRLDRLREFPVEEWEPLLYCYWAEDDSWLLVDGNHRYTLAAELGIKALPSLLIPEEVWREFIVEDAPPITSEQLRNLESGL